MTDFDQVPPHSDELEESIISTCFLAGGEALTEIVDLVDPEYFYKNANKIIFSAIQEISFKADSADSVTVAELLKSKKQIDKAGGISYLARLIDEPIAVDIEFSCKKLEEKFLLRKAIERSYATIKRCHNSQDDFDGVMDYYVRSANEVSDRSKSGDSVTDMKKLSIEAADVYDTRYKEQKIITGVPTGIHDLDLKTFGQHPGDLTLIAARPGMGKTATAVNVLKNTAENGYGSLFISLEMPEMQLYDRLVAIDTGINGMNIRIGNFTKKEFKMVQDSISKIFDLPIYIDDRGGQTFNEIRKTIRRQIKLHPEIAIIIIDHLQLVRGNNPQNRNLEIGEISSGLKSLAKELRLPVVALSQLNRELERRNNPYKRPKLSDLRDSGSLEQDADNVIFLYRPWEYGDNISPVDGVSEVQISESDYEMIIAKQRQGPVGTVHCNFYPDCQRVSGKTIESPNTIYKKRLEEREDD